MLNRTVLFPLLLQLSLALALSGVSPGSSYAAEKDATPQAPIVKDPAFPREPGRKKPQKVSADSLVEGDSSPPQPELETRFKVESQPSAGGSEERGWRTELRVGWFYTSQGSKQDLVGTAPGTIPLRQEVASPLSGILGYTLTPPSTGLSLKLSAGESFGKLEAIGSGLAANQVRFSFQEFFGGIEPRFRITSRNSPHVVSLAVEGLFRRVAQASLDQAQTAISAEDRTEMTWTPTLAYAYAPRADWEGAVSIGYARAIQLSGGGNSEGSNYRAWKAKLEAFRYVAPKTALGLGVDILDWRADWRRTLPSTLGGVYTSTETRVAFYWRKDY